MADGDGILLLLEFEDSDSGWGRLVRLQRGASRPVWVHDLQCFNLVAPVRRSHDLFLAGLAFAARLDARTGRFVWRHVGRYKSGDMDAPERLDAGKIASSFEGQLEERRRPIVSRPQPARPSPACKVSGS